MPLECCGPLRGFHEAARCVCREDIRSILLGCPPPGKAILSVMQLLNYSRRHFAGILTEALQQCSWACAKHERFNQWGNAMTVKKCCARRGGSARKQHAMKISLHGTVHIRDIDNLQAIRLCYYKMQSALVAC